MRFPHSISTDHLPLCLTVCLLLSVSGCNLFGDDEPEPTPTGPEVSLSYDFEASNEGWTGGFSDYPQGEEVAYELSFGHDFLPDEMGIEDRGMRISGSNRSDDLFMFFKRQVFELEPNTEYEVEFELQIASQYPANAPGIGGSPGSSVYLKAGVVTTEPKAIQGNLGYPAMVMNIDKGNQSIDGVDMQILGDIGIPGDDYVYTLIDRTNLDQRFSFQTDDTGTAWLIIGTDSGYEGSTNIYYNQISVKFFLP
ncbi:hypothetical protein [Pontibacter sp. G13]|uniref:hypothetical protein n=1 Tax=Pontibacter sp. G13 TaxID=3074898 RepID=UPI00288BDAD4|nr:hypothetical protein [Pontibacter sp. G13]WNJ16131.1 hypothetical protein RJD25_14810 [Pontibacter sp. G13]